MKRYLAMLRSVVKKEVRQTVRDKRMMVLLLGVPLIQLFLFGHAVNLDVDQVPTVVVDLDDTDTSREHIRRLLADGTLADAGRDRSVSRAERRLEVGTAAVVLVIERGFEDHVARGRRASVQAILDGSDPNRANVAGAAIGAYFQGQSEALILAKVTRLSASRGQAARVPRVDVESRVLFNPQLESAIYMVPGVAAMLLLIITTIVSAMGLAREREIGTLEQILVTPIPSVVFIAGKIFPFAVIGLLDFGLALIVGATVFDMPLRGSMALLLLATVLYLGTTLGIGLLISTVSQSQQQAFLGGFLFMLPAALLSGIMTPVLSMPEWLQTLTLANPLRHYAEILRGSLLRGAGFVELSNQLLILGGMGFFIFTIASLRFRSSMR
ncbi:MAG: ABC transporter permease [Deltaproteobacteria bacterium]|nr:MAG: ABC transporter permease [Deltaproteobacteria bacterium]